MRFSSIAATLAAVSGVSALPQKFDPSTKPAAPASPAALDAIPKFVVPVPLEEAKKKFENDTAAPARVNLLATTAAAAATCANPRTRPEWDAFPDADKQAFIDAIKCLTKLPKSGNFAGATSRYEDLVSLHQTLTPKIHNNDLFLLWHRYYIWVFEDMLRTECGYTRDLPWWDEAKWAGKFPSSSVFSAKWFGSVNTGGNCVTNGQFNSSAYTLNIGVGPSNSPHCLSRNYNSATTSNVGSTYVNYCNSLTTYHNMASCSEGGPHAYGHNGVGGVMSDPYASPSDPTFFLHHGFVDHSWAVWQRGSATRVSSISGAKDSNGATITLDTVISMNGLRPSVKVRDVLDTQSTTLCFKYST